MHLIRIWLVIGTFLVCGCYGCRSKPEPKSPEEFIETYSKAWQGEDVDAILNLQLRPSYADSGGDPALRRTFEDSSKAIERTAIEESIRRHDFAYTAWTKTTFEGARDHGDHIHVDVRIDAAHSEVVLVRNGGLLKIHPNPSRFQ
jgi:hypothetical protein